jgi:uncharacterized membrane protein YagU involved in acid resistance
MTPTFRAAWRWILAATLVGGTIDISYALATTLLRGGSAQKLLQAVGSGWLGKASFEGGMASAALGLASHYAIILVATILFFAASRRFAVLREHACIAGLLYGLAIFLVMNFVVVPLSAAPFQIHYRLWPTVGELASHLLGVGLPISFITRRAFGRAPA